LRGAPLKEAILRDAGTWDALVLRGVTLARRAERTPSKADWAVWSDTLIMLSESEKNRFKRYHYLVTDQQKIVAISFLDQELLAGHYLKTDANSDGQSQIGVLSIFQSSYQVQMIPLYYQDLIVGERRQGGIHVLNPLQLFKTLNRWEQRSLFFLVFLFLFYFLYFLIRKLTRHLQKRWALFVSYLLTAFLPLLILSGFLQQWMTATFSEQITKQALTDLKVVHHAVQEKTDMLQEKAMQGLRSYLLSPASSLSPMIHWMDANFPMEEGFFILKETAWDERGRRWTKKFFYSPKTPRRVRQPAELDKIFKSGLVCHGLWGEWLVGVSQYRLKEDKTYTLYLFYSFDAVSEKYFPQLIQGRALFYQMNGLPLSEKTDSDLNYAEACYHRSLFDALQLQIGPHLIKLPDGEQALLSLWKDPRGEPGGLLSIRYPATAIYGLQSKSLWTLSFLLFMVIIIGLGWWFSRRSGDGIVPVQEVKSAEGFLGRKQAILMIPEPPFMRIRKEELSQTAASGVPGKDSFVQESKTADVIEKSRTIEAILEFLSHLESSEATLLLEGESGAGKSYWAQYLFSRSTAFKRNFVVIDLATIPPNLLESELFGYERGAFSGAVERKIGKLELAQGGTLVLDKIESLPLPLQVKILPFIENKTFVRIGGHEPVAVQCRIIVITAVDLNEWSRSGKFREDLYYRLNVFHLKIPALREHAEDIPLLADHFLQEMNTKHQRQIKTVDPALMKNLLNREWSGNIRELKNYIEKLVILSKEGQTVLSDSEIDQNERQRIQEETFEKVPAKQIQVIYEKIIFEMNQKKIFLLPRQKDIVRYVLENGFVSRKEIVKLMNISPKTAFRDLNYLTQTNILKMKGRGRSTRYYL